MHACRSQLCLDTEHHACRWEWQYGNGHTHYGGRSCLFRYWNEWQRRECACQRKRNSSGSIMHIEREPQSGDRWHPNYVVSELQPSGDEFRME
ncbi:MAG: hypothetical protein Q8O37_00285 [Sulfuricellaceae bacterium]|nr:hypothetical protein [Sulfuricellaceae bacterium]